MKFRQFDLVKIALGVVLLATCSGGEGGDLGGTGGSTNAGSGGSSGMPVFSGKGGAAPSVNGGAGGVSGAAGTAGAAGAPAAIISGSCDPKFLAPFCENAGGQKLRIIGFDDKPYAATPTLAEVRKFALDAVNAIRARTCLQPLAPDDCLDKIGTAANDAVKTLGIHGYFKENCMNSAHGFGKSCECNWTQENYGSASGSSRTWKDGIIVPLCGMMEEPKGQGHRGNIESPDWRRMGSGVTWTTSGAGWCHEFGR